MDAGITVGYFLDYLRRRKPASLKLCALFDKPASRKVSVPIDYLGFTIPDKFVVGYGLDYDEKFRHLPQLYFIED
ncbi:Hypoxanthine phosphoribosyltransferase [subsurface metagenome]